MSLSSCVLVLCCFASYQVAYTMSTTVSLRSRLLASRSAKSYGPFLLSSSPTIAEILAGIGYSHIVVDMEHAPLDIGSTLDMFRAIDAMRHPSTTTIVRMPCHNDVAMTKKILDVLKKPAGILFPLVETAEDAKLAVSSTRYPEFGGIRGCAHPFVRASGYGKDTEYYDKTSRDLLTMVQVESFAAIQNIPEIAAVEGLDGIFIGPFDVSASLGKVGQFEEGGEVMQLIRQAEQSVTDAGVVLAGFRNADRSLHDMFSSGYQLVCGSIDLGLIRDAATRDLEAAEAIMDDDTHAD